MTEITDKKDVSKVFSLRTRSKKIIHAISISENPNRFIEDIIEKYVTGKLVLVEDAKKTQELAELKFRDYKAKIILKEYDAKVKMIHHLKFTPQQTADVFNNRKTIFNVNVSNKIIQEDGTLRCFTCGQIFEMRGYDFQQVDEYEKHCLNQHDRKLFDNEREEMLKVLGEIAK